jgi:integrase/recombinase XerD
MLESFEMKKSDYNITSFKKRSFSLENIHEFNYNLLTGIKSKKTLEDYFFYLLNFLKTIYTVDKKIPDNKEIIAMLYEISKEDLSNYIMFLKNEKQLKHSSINKIIAALKHFFKEIEVRDELFKNPIKNIKYFKNDPFDPEKILRLSRDDIKKMLVSITINNEKDLRNSVIMKTLYYTGMRSNELRSLKYKDLIQKDDKFIVRLSKTKSQTIQYIPLNQILLEEIFKYKKDIMYHFNFSELEMMEKYIFPSFFEKNSKLTSNSLNFMIKKISKQSINKDISAHNFRHAIATEMLLSDNNISITDVQDFLRHANIATTKIYDDAIELKKQKTVEKIPTL